MKTIGLIGGMSWESTAIYYQIINREVGGRLGGLNSGKIVLYSVNFGEIEPLQRASKWDEAGEAILLDAKYASSGADSFYSKVNSLPFARDRVLNMAWEQIDAAEKAGIGRIEWHISHSEAASALEELFERSQIDIDIVHTAWQP